MTQALSQCTCWLICADSLPALYETVVKSVRGQGCCLQIVTRSAASALLLSYTFQLLPVCRDAVVGRNCRFLQGPQTDQAEVKRMRDAMAADPPRPVTVKLLNYRRDGQPFWNNLHVAPIRSACGQVRGGLTTANFMQFI